MIMFGVDFVVRHKALNSSKVDKITLMSTLIDVADHQ